MPGAVFFVQKLGVVTEYLTTVDNATGGSGDGANLVRELAEDAERKSKDGSCGSDGEKMFSASSSLTSSDDDDDVDDDDDDMDDFVL